MNWWYRLKVKKAFESRSGGWRTIFCNTVHYSSHRRWIVNIGKLATTLSKKTTKLTEHMLSHALSVPSTRKMVANQFFRANITLCVCFFFVVLAFFPLLLSFGFCCCFSILGKPQKPKPACNNRIVYNFTCVFIRDNNLPYLTIVERFRSDNGGSGDADRHRPRLCSLCKICSFMVRNKTKWMHVNDNLLVELVLVVGFER